MPANRANSDPPQPAPPLQRAQSRLRERIRLQQRLQLEAGASDRTRKERSAEVRVSSQMNITGRAIAKGFQGISGRVDTPAFQKARPYTIGPNPCQCRPAPRPRPVVGVTFQGEVIVIFVEPGPVPED